MHPADGEVLVESVRVLRAIKLAKREEFVSSDRFDSRANDRRPHRDDFRPTTEDRKQRPVRVSVWNHQFTKAAQAQRFMPQAIVSIWSLLVSQVLGAASQNELAGRVRVVGDPENAPSRNEGWVGHSGIEGLETEGNDREAIANVRTLRADLAFLARPTCPTCDTVPTADKLECGCMGSSAPPAPATSL